MAVDKLAWGVVIAAAACLTCVEAQCTVGSQWRAELAMPYSLQEVVTSVVGTKMYV